MRVPRIYQETTLAKGLKLALDKHAVLHVMTVLRLKIADKIILFNGNGNEYPADIIEARHHHLTVEIQDEILKNNESPLTIHLGQVISKAERMDYTLQKATELGASQITPLFSTRCDLHLKGEREEKKMTHWQKVLISACEQCGRNQIPVLFAIQKFKEWVRASDMQTKIFLDHRSKTSLKDISIGASVGIMVGPEGGFTFEEKVYAEEQGFIAVQMGPRILRTETAGLAAITLIQFLAGDMGRQI
jgi:16S rRNA (uracil1498-N3)-methyltransferase